LSKSLNAKDIVAGQTVYGAAPFEADENLDTRFVVVQGGDKLIAIPVVNSGKPPHYSIDGPCNTWYATQMDAILETANQLRGYAEESIEKAERAEKLAARLNGEQN
jgi:hypothetical protein